MSEWKNSLNFGESTFIEHKVGEGTLQFYPVSVGTMFKLKDLLQPIGKAIVALTADNSKDAGRIIRDIGEPFKMPDGKPYKIKGPDGSEAVLRDAETIFEAISPELAKLRDEQKSRAIDNLIGALMEEKNLLTISGIVVNSLQLDKPPHKVPAHEFFNSMEFPLFCECVIGVIKANKGVFEPVGKLVRPVLGRIHAGVAQKLEDHTTPNRSENLPPDGETSPTPS